ncbi:MAG: putative photosynthetic complex assembly protein PuhE [Pseudomonadota bacterium]
MSALAVLYALVVWWSTTQAILWLVRYAPKPALNAIALVLAMVSAVLAVLAAREPSVHAAYVGFTAGVGLWGAFEISFLTGAVLGVNHDATSERIGARAWAALKAIIWHEAALVATLIGLLAATVMTLNPVALATFAGLWLMRASAKLNLFLGVRNLCTDFLPASVAHLAKHFRLRRMNPLFPFSVVFGTLAAAALLRAGLDPTAAPYEAVGAMLVATMVALGVAEHWLLVTPLSALDLFSQRISRDTLSRPLGVFRSFG